MAHYQQYYNQNLHVLPIQFWYCTSLQWYNTRNTPNLNSFCWNAKMMSFSNLTLTLFTYFLFASTMYKHIFGLILVTHEDLGVQLDHNNQFSIIWLSKSNFPTLRERGGAEAWQFVLRNEYKTNMCVNRMARI